MLSKNKKIQARFYHSYLFRCLSYPVWISGAAACTSYHVEHTVFDDMIPFCEIFIIPYLLWFPYVIMTVVYFLFRNKNKKEYFQLIAAPDIQTG